MTLITDEMLKAITKQSTVKEYGTYIVAQKRRMRGGWKRKHKGGK